MPLKKLLFFKKICYIEYNEATKVYVALSKTI